MVVVRCAREGVSSRPSKPGLDWTHDRGGIWELGPRCRCEPGAGEDGGGGARQEEPQTAVGTDLGRSGEAAAGAGGWQEVFGPCQLSWCHCPSEVLGRP